MKRKILILTVGFLFSVILSFAWFAMNKVSKSSVITPAVAEKTLASKPATGSQTSPPIHAKPKPKPVLITIQPYSDMPVSLTSYIYEHLKLIYPNVVLRAAVPLPQAAYYAPRNRYRADSLIRGLARKTPSGTVILALTSKDISTTHNNFPDWGIMGLSFCPGRACIASSYRLNRNNLSEQFFKIAIHELGHTQGLGHCPDTNCFMRDAKGKNTTDVEKEFCPKCKEKLVKAGWVI